MSSANPRSGMDNVACHKNVRMVSISLIWLCFVIFVTTHTIAPARSSVLVKAFNLDNSSLSRRHGNKQNKAILTVCKQETIFATFLNERAAACIAHISTTLAILSCPFRSDALVNQMDASTTRAIASNSVKVWELPNGQVETPNPLTLFPSYKLRNPSFLGSGGGGAVFSYYDDDSNKDIAIKFSWVRSAKSVERECDVLKVLEAGSNINRSEGNNLSPTRNVEKCLGMERYGPDPRRVVIALEPVVDNVRAVSTVAEVDKEKQTIAVEAIVCTMVDMLAANVVTTDVQPLINRETGEVLFIDMTEAQIMSSPDPSFLDLALTGSFCSEMAALIPSPSSLNDAGNDESYFESLAKHASVTLLRELRSQSSRGVRFSAEVYSILQGQSLFVSSPETLDYIDNILSKS